MIKNAKDYTNAFLESERNSLDPLLIEKFNNTMYLADKIYQLIQKNGLSKSEFAKKLNKRPSEITKWLYGSHNFTIHTLTEICWALNIKVKDLFTRNEINHDKQSNYIIITLHSTAAPRKGYVPIASEFFNAQNAIQGYNSLKANLLTTAINEN